MSRLSPRAKKSEWPRRPNPNPPEPPPPTKNGGGPALGLIRALSLAQPQPVLSFANPAGSQFLALSETAAFSCRTFLPAAFFLVWRRCDGPPPLVIVGLQRAKREMNPLRHRNVKDVDLSYAAPKVKSKAFPVPLADSGRGRTPCLMYSFVLAAGSGRSVSSQASPKRSLPSWPDYIALTSAASNGDCETCLS